MTQLVDKAFAAISALPPEEQDAFAEWILEELASEERWQIAFARSADKLVQLASEARAEYQAGHTRLLDPDEL